MKTLRFILISVLMLGCGGAAPSEKTRQTADNSSGSINLPLSGDDPNPCDGRSQFSEIKVDGITYVVQIPYLCNEGPLPLPDDPGPDQRNSSLWEEKAAPLSSVESPFNR